MDKVLLCWGFSTRFRRMIYTCLSSVTYAVLINGCNVGEVDPSRGLRQGNSLSPYLFILCIEILSRLLEKNNDVQGIKIGRNAPSINHLLYADDLVIAGRANVKNARAIWDCIDKFCSWSGQQVNRDKSSILFSTETSRETRRRISEIWGLRRMKENLIYLGNALILWRNNRRNFDRLRDQLQVRLEGWQSKLLSKAGKATLIKSVAQAIPVYSMSTFKILKGVCENMDAMVRRF